MTMTWPLWDKSESTQDRRSWKWSKLRVCLDAMQGLGCGLCVETPPGPPSTVRGGEDTESRQRVQASPALDTGSKPCLHLLLGCEPHSETHWLLSSVVRVTSTFSRDRVVLSGWLSTSSSGSRPAGLLKALCPRRPQDGPGPGQTLAPHAPGLVASGSNTPRQCECSAGLAALRDMTRPSELGLCHQTVQRQQSTLPPGRHCTRHEPGTCPRALAPHHDLSV